MTTEDELRKCPPWIDRKELLSEVARVLFHHQMTVGQFYDALGIDVHDVTRSDPTEAINFMADLRRQWTLASRRDPD